MKIPSLNQQIGRTGQSDPRTDATGADRNRRPVLDSVHGDSIEISLNQDLSALSEAPLVQASAQSTLSPERLAEIRARIESGYYSTPDGLKNSADSLLEFHSLPV